MGMNYYYYDFEKRSVYHIGKSSYGWEFTFEAQPKIDVYSSSQWKIFLDLHIGEGEIRDEEDKKVGILEFLELIDKKYRKEKYTPDGQLKSHFDHVQSKDFEDIKSLRLQHGIPLNLKLEDIQPSNCWKDWNGNSIILGEFS